MSRLSLLNGNKDAARRVAACLVEIIDQASSQIDPTELDVAKQKLVSEELEACHGPSQPNDHMPDTRPCGVAAGVVANTAVAKQRTALVQDAEIDGDVEEAGLRSVLTFEKKWAALILAGLKTSEVRAAPTNIRGSIGIAISEVPGLIVGQVDIEDVEHLTLSEIAKRQAQTRLSPQELAKYIKKSSGHIYKLLNPRLYEEPIPHATDGQVWKGKPNVHEQMLVNMATIRVLGNHENDVRALMERFETYKQRQATTASKDARNFSRQLKMLADPATLKRPAAAFDRLQRLPFKATPSAKRAKQPTDFAAQVDSLPAASTL